MEVTVLEATNTPKKPVIAVRAGSSLRHADMVLNTPFRVPLHGLEDNRIKVSLYQQLGTQTIPDADEAESICNVPVRTPDGKCSQVKLCVRRSQNTAFPNGTGTVGADAYLSHHQLEARIQSLFEIVLKKQPEDPYRCMIEELQKAQQTGQESAASADAIVQSTAPKAPVAPAEPPPKNPRPSPANARKPKLQQQSEAEKLALAQIRTGEYTLQAPASENIGSLNNARQKARSDAAKALSNLELAHEVMRMCIRQVVADMALQSGSLGSSRQQLRLAAMEHAKNVKISYPVRRMVMAAALARIAASSLGFSCHTPGDQIVCVRDKVKSEETKALTQAVVKSLLHKASACI